MCHKFNKSIMIFLCFPLSANLTGTMQLAMKYHLNPSINFVIWVSLFQLICRGLLILQPLLIKFAKKLPGYWACSIPDPLAISIMLTLYKSMVRSLVEYCCPLWHPTKIQDIQELESVHETFTARIAGMQDMHYSYWYRLIHLSLMSLQRRRERFIIASCTCGKS